MRSVPPGLIEEPLPHPSPSSSAAKPLTADWSTAQLPPPPGYTLIVPKGNAKPIVQNPNIAEILDQAEALYKRKQYAEAKPLLEQACAGGYVDACDDLALMYDGGRGVARNSSRAAALFSKVCDAGIVQRCTSLGVMYLIGIGVTQDYPKAAALFNKACDAGDASGCSHLGELYWVGAGVQKDTEKARQLLNKGCSMGDQEGCDWLK